MGYVSFESNRFISDKIVHKTDKEKNKLSVIGDSVFGKIKKTFTTTIDIHYKVDNKEKILVYKVSRGDLENFLKKEYALSKGNKNEDIKTWVNKSIDSLKDFNKTTTINEIIEGESHKTTESAEIDGAKIKEIQTKESETKKTKVKATFNKLKRLDQLLAFNKKQSYWDDYSKYLANHCDIIDINNKSEVIISNSTDKHIENLAERLLDNTIEDTVLFNDIVQAQFNTLNRSSRDIWIKVPILELDYLEKTQSNKELFQSLTPQQEQANYEDYLRNVAQRHLQGLLSNEMEEEVNKLIQAADVKQFSKKS